MRWTWAAVLATAVAALATPRALLAAVQDPPTPAPPATAPAGDEPAPAPSNGGPSALKIGLTVAELAETLVAPATPPALRLEAARRLVARQSNEARDELRRAITTPGNVEARVAAMRALADDPNPAPDLVDALIDLVKNGEPERVVNAAADALAAYKGNARVIQALIDVASGRRAAPMRLPAIRALGLFVDQQAAAALVRLMTAPGADPATVGAAADALIEMTTLEAYGRDPNKWNEWLARSATRQPAEWREELYRAQQRRQDRQRRRAEDTALSAQQIAKDLYDATPADEKPRFLLRYLRAPSADARRIGARIAGQVAELNPRQITPEIQTQMIELISDADPGVRLAVTDALYNINTDPKTALDRLLTQLKVETDSAVKASVARKLSRVAGVRQVPELTALLDDSAPEVVREAARAISLLAKDFTQDDAELAASTAEKLRKTMGRLAAQPAFLDARVECGKALAALPQQGSENLNLGRNLLKASEPPEIRAVALRILGEQGPQASDMITRAVDDETRFPAVRAEGIRALVRTNSFEQAEWLVKKMSPGVEPDPAVRKAARDAYVALLPSANARRLVTEADRRKGDPALRVDVLKELIKQLDDADQRSDAAFQRQNIGDVYLTDLGRPKDAVPYLEAALKYYRGAGTPRQVTEVLVSQLIKAMLLDRQYVPLIRLAGEVISKASPDEAALYHSDFGYRVRNEVDALIAKNDLEHGAALIDAALKMEPPLRDDYRKDLEQYKGQIEAKRSRSGTGP